MTWGSWVDGDEWKVIAPRCPARSLRWWRRDVPVGQRRPGKTWALKKQVTANSPRNHNYARARGRRTARSSRSGPMASRCVLRVAALLLDSTGENVWQLPYDMAGESAEPWRYKQN